MKPVGNKELTSIKAAIAEMKGPQKDKMQRLLDWTMRLEKYVAVALSEEDETEITQVVEGR